MGNGKTKFVNFEQMPQDNTAALVAILKHRADSLGLSFSELLLLDIWMNASEMAHHLLCINDATTCFLEHEGYAECGICNEV